MEKEASDILIFFGRFHPLLLHLPIGFLIIAVILEALSRFNRFRQYKPSVGLALLLGASSAFIAAVLGYLLGQAGGYNEELLTTHQWAGISLAAISIIAVLLHWQRERKASAILDKVYIIMLSLMMISLAITGHYGGSLTHGSDYLTQYMPNGLRKVAGLAPKKDKKVKKITNLNEAIIFNDIIHPILDTRCISCHNENKRKGDLMMHSPEGLLKGGENGPIFKAGNADASEMMRRIHLPEHDEDHMPPDGKSQLSDEQIELLAWWINEEATFDKTVAEVNVDEKVQSILNTLVDPDANKTEAEKLLSSKIKPADELVLTQLQKKGVQVESLAADNFWLQAKIPPGIADDSLVFFLTKVSEQLTWLNLSGTLYSDQALSFIGELKNLTRLHLEKSKITGQDLEYIKNLPYLEYLNLYGTQVNNEDIQQLSSLKNLRNLYVWQTNVTQEGAMQLQKNLPGLEVNLGYGSQLNDTIMNAGKNNIDEPLAKK